MPFCPFPHATRDQIWLATGASIGAAIAYFCLPRRGHTSVWKEAPSVLLPKSPVVKTDDLTIQELVGNATNGDESTSIAHVTVNQACTEATQTPGFDEYVYVMKGSMVVLVGGQEAAGPKRETPVTLEAKAGEVLWLPKGHRYCYTFPGKCEYIATCSPAFKDSIAGRES